PDQVGLIVAARAARDDGAALTTTTLDRGKDILELRFADDGTDLGRRVERVADLAALDACEERVAEPAVDGVLDVDAARCGALLAGRPESAGVRRLDGTAEVCVGHHDQRVVTSELELDAFAGLRCCVAHSVPGRDGA